MFIPAGHICGKLHNLFPHSLRQYTYVPIFLIEGQMLPRDEDLSETNFKVSGKLMMYLPENEIDFFCEVPSNTYALLIVHL